MKIITKTTFVVGKGKTVGPGELIDLDDSEALSLIERGLAEVGSTSDDDDSEAVIEQTEASAT